MTNTNDQGAGSLRQALECAYNASSSAVAVIGFAIPETDPGFVDVDAHLTAGDAEPDFTAAIRRAKRTLFVAIPSGPEPGANIDGEARAPCTLNLPNILCVTTSSPSGGVSCGAVGPRSVDVAVPVENSVTTGVGGATGVPTACATSFAAPTAAGVATILFGAVPKATPAQVRAAIIAGARRTAGFRGKTVSGGVIDADAALRILRARVK